MASPSYHPLAYSKAVCIASNQGKRRRIEEKQNGSTSAILESRLAVMALIYETTCELLSYHLN